MGAEITQNGTRRQETATPREQTRHRPGDQDFPQTPVGHPGTDSTLPVLVASPSEGIPLIDITDSAMSVSTRSGQDTPPPPLRTPPAQPLLAFGRHVRAARRLPSFRWTTRDRRTGPSKNRPWKRTFGFFVLIILAGALALSLSAAHHAHRFIQALRGEDLVTAQQQIDKLRTDVRIAHWATTPLRPFGKIPLLGRPAADIIHAVDAAGYGVDAAAQGTELYRLARSGHVVKDGRVDLELVEQLPPHTVRLSEDLVKSRDALTQVRGGWFPGIIDSRDKAVSQLDRVVPPVQLADSVIRELPEALGGQGPRTYIVATLNSGELFPSGGALLAVAQLRVEDGGMEIVSRGQVSQLTGLNQPVPWTPLPTDPWQADTVHQRLANANYSPDFPTSGEEILRLYQAQFGQQASGVIALDAMAFQSLLTLTGPIQSPTYGEVTSANVVQKTLIDAYQVFDGEFEARHSANDNLIDLMFTALLRTTPTKDGALTVRNSMRAGHIQMYFRQAGLQSGLARTHLDRGLVPFTDDTIGVYAVNTNASKVDIFQERSVAQDVVLAEDGSAQVTRTVRLVNDPRRPCPPSDKDPGNGYLTCVSRPRVYFYVPERATDLAIGVVGREPPVPARNLSVEKGRVYFATKMTIDPKADATIVVRYRLPATPQRSGYTLHWEGQPMVRTPNLTVRVTPPPGQRLTGTGWQRDGQSLVISVPMTGSGDLRLVEADSSAVS